MPATILTCTQRMEDSVQELVLVSHLTIAVLLRAGPRAPDLCSVSVSHFTLGMQKSQLHKYLKV